MNFSQKAASGALLITVFSALLWVSLLRETEKVSQKSVELTADILLIGPGLRSPEEEMILGHSSSLTLHYEKIGKYWSEMLANEKVPHDWRVYAARVLGDMRYAPAIPILIKNITLKDDRVYDYSGEIGESFVCHVALEHFGSAAVPAVVDAYLEEKDSNHRIFLLKAIPGTVTEIYLSGLHVQHDERVTADILRELKENRMGLDQTHFPEASGDTP